MTAERDPAGAAMAAQSDDLAANVRDGLVARRPLPVEPPRLERPLAAQRPGRAEPVDGPTVMIEAGNMRNSGDAALMSSAGGQQQVAQGLANGVFSYLGSG